MMNWQFCFLSDEYYEKFPNHGLMENKEEVNSEVRNRPCFFAFEDTVHKDIFWLVPISSNYNKYRAIYEKNMRDYGRCPFIRFGEVLGTQASFLIQNICPVTERYIQEIYVDKNNKPVQIDNRIIDDVVSNARLTLAKASRGAKLLFSKAFVIKEVLLAEINSEKEFGEKK